MRKVILSMTSICFPNMHRGANWIHGTDHNPILDMAKETNTIACPTGEDACVFDELGKVMEDEKAKKLAAIVWGIIADAFKYSNESESIPPDRSLRDFFVEQLEQKDLTEAEKKTVLQMGEMWGAFVGAPYESQSLKFFWLEECIDGGMFVAC